MDVTLNVTHPNHYLVVDRKTFNGATLGAVFSQMFGQMS